MNSRNCYLALGLLSLLSLGWFGWQQLKTRSADWFPVNQVRVTGTFQQITKPQIEQVVSAYAMDGLYRVDLQALQHAVSQLAWVARAKVGRVWPDALLISIEEQTPIARWGEHALLNQAGQVFVPDQRKGFEHLPWLAGPAGSEAMMLAAMNKMAATLLDKGLLLTALQVNERRAWKLVLNDKITVNIGTHKPQPAFNRFLTTLGLLGSEQINKIAAVDLRYANGYALRWEPGMENIEWKKIAALNKT